MEPQLLYEYAWKYEPGSGGEIYPQPIYEVTPDAFLP